MVVMRGVAKQLRIENLELKNREGSVGLRMVCGLIGIKVHMPGLAVARPGRCLLGADWVEGRLGLGDVVERD